MFIVWLCVLVTSQILIMVLLPQMGFPPWTLALPWLIYAPLLTWLIISFVGQYRNIQKRIIAGELPCWRCAYNLNAQPEVGICSECGEPFDEASLRAKWSHAITGTADSTSHGPPIA